MRLTSFSDWIRQIYATRDEELDCDQVFELIAGYVDKVVAGEATTGFSDVEHHLQQCPYCYDIFVGMRDAAVLEEEQVPELAPLESPESWQSRCS
jgi:predicted anti-sigma-YlaC factor YlaD